MLLVVRSPRCSAIGEAERGQHQLGGAQRKDAARVVVRSDRVVESVEVGPAVVVLRPALDGVDQIEHLFVVSHPLGEFALVVAERVATVAPNRILHLERRLEESAGGIERVGDDAVEFVAGQQEEPVIAARPVEIGERGGAGVADVDDGDQVHRRTLRGVPTGLGPQLTHQPVTASHT
jgi:hypothetical protein